MFFSMVMLIVSVLQNEMFDCVKIVTHLSHRLLYIILVMIESLQHLLFSLMLSNYLTPGSVMHLQDH